MDETRLYEKRGHSNEVPVAAAALDETDASEIEESGRGADTQSGITRNTRHTSSSLTETARAGSLPLQASDEARPLAAGRLLRLQTLGRRSSPSTRQPWAAASVIDTKQFVTLHSLTLADRGVR